MREAVRAELFKIGRRRMTYILLTTLVLLVVLFYFLLWLRAQQGPEPRFRGRAQYLALLESMAFASVEAYGLQLVRLFGTVVTVIFAGMVTGNEYGWGTAALAISRGTPRLPFLAAKMLVCVGFVLVAVTLGALTAAIASAWLSYLYELPFGATWPDRVITTLAAEGRTAFVMLPFVFMAILVATVGRSAGQAVGFALGFFFLETIFTRVFQNSVGWVSHIPGALLNANVAVVMQLNGAVVGGGVLGGADAASPGSSVGQAVVVLVAYIVTFALLALWRIRRKDLIG